MISTITQAIVHTITSDNYPIVSFGLEVLATVVLIVLLIQRDLVRLPETPRSKEWTGALQAVIAPLLIVFAIIVCVRVVQILAS